MTYSFVFVWVCVCVSPSHSLSLTLSRPVLMNHYQFFGHASPQMGLPLLAPSSHNESLMFYVKAPVCMLKTYWNIRHITSATLEYVMRLNCHFVCDVSRDNAAVTCSEMYIRLYFIVQKCIVMLQAYEGRLFILLGWVLDSYYEWRLGSYSLNLHIMSWVNVYTWKPKVYKKKKQEILS